MLKHLKKLDNYWAYAMENHKKVLTLYVGVDIHHLNRLQ